MRLYYSVAVVVVATVVVASVRSWYLLRCSSGTCGHAWHQLPEKSISSVRKHVICVPSSLRSLQSSTPLHTSAGCMQKRACRHEYQDGGQRLRRVCVALTLCSLCTCPTSTVVPPHIVACCVSSLRHNPAHQRRRRSRRLHRTPAPL